MTLPVIPRLRRPWMPRQLTRVQGGRVENMFSTVSLASPLRTDGKKLSRLTGLAVPYNQWTPRFFYLLAIAMGSLDKSITEVGGRLPLLEFHDDMSHPVADSVDWDSRKDGLWGAWDLREDERSQAAGRAAAAGLGLSIRFGTILADWEFTDADFDDARMDISQWDRMTLVEGRLIETSLTPTPAYANAQVSTVLSRPTRATPELDKWKSYLATLKS